MTRTQPRRALTLLLALVASFSLLHPPAPVLAQEGETLLLVWAANEEQDLRGYRVYETDDLGTLEALVQEVLVEDIPWEDSTQGIVTFEIPDVPPGDHCWAVTAFDYPGNESLPSAAACISLDTQESSIHLVDYYEEGFYGTFPGAAQSHDEGVVYTFDGKPGELLLTYRLWSIDSPGEVEILVNGNSLGYADMTGRYTASPVLTLRIPPECLNEFDLNTLTFAWNSAGVNDMWAVGNVEIVELIPLPAPGYYGNLANVRYGDTSHPRIVGFVFEPTSFLAVIRYRAFDVDFEGEIEILVNGHRVGEVTSLANNALTNSTLLFLMDDVLLSDERNTIVFRNVLNPPYNLIWGVGQVEFP